VGDKVLNQAIASSRVPVEHAIAGVKRSRLVKDVLRLTLEGISDVVMEIACALHNLRVRQRRVWLPIELPGGIFLAYPR
jgi:hypothetical protein